MVLIYRLSNFCLDTLLHGILRGVIGAKEKFTFSPFPVGYSLLSDVKDGPMTRGIKTR